MNETLFYVLGTGLALLAVLTSLVGLRARGFPATRGATVAIFAAFAIVALGATTFAVRQSQDEEAHREQAAGLPQATEEAEAEESEEGHVE